MRKKALLIGINKYHDAPLRGCVNDVVLMYHVLTNKYDFNNNDIKVLTDHNATRRNILEHLEWLVRGVNSGDKLFFHFSGHGSQVPVDNWTNSDDIDGLDEIICNVDLDWDNPIRDHDLGGIFHRLPKGVTTTAILDCCHSGTGLRNSVKMPVELQTEHDYINRFMSPPVEHILRNPTIKITDDLMFELPMSDSKDVRTMKRKFLVDTSNQGDVLLISGCQDNQTSADAWIGNKYHGALSRVLVSVLAQNNFEMSYRALVTDVNVELDKFGYTQNPQLEGCGDLFDNHFLS